jgi:hypothetical protein
MSKLAQFRQWLEVDNAAQYLSTVWGESVTPADVLRLGLDGKLTLSVHLVNLGYGREVDIVPVESLQWEEFPHPSEPNTTIRIPDGDIMNATQAMKIRETDTASQLSGVYDLPMIGGEKIQIEHYYQGATGGPPVGLVNIAGVFVQRGGRTYQVLERWPSDDHHKRSNKGKPYLHIDWFFPSAQLPADSVIVVRTDALRELEPTQPNPWGNHDTKLLRDLAAAADQFWKLYDPADPSTAPTNEQVGAFLVNRGVARRTAEVMATILRADGLPTGPRK